MKPKNELENIKAADTVEIALDRLLDQREQIYSQLAEIQTSIECLADVRNNLMEEKHE